MFGSRRIALRSAALVGAILLLSFVGLGVHFSFPSQSGPYPIAFAGWTNVAGEKSAILIMPPPSTSRLSHNSLLKRTFRFELEIRHLLDSGAETLTKIEDRFGSGFPAGPTPILVPVAPAVRSISVTRAEGILGGYWDNAMFGWKPSSSPRSRTLCTYILTNSIPCD